jgi:uncharacterized protein YcbK (DUF882 family)
VGPPSELVRLLERLRELKGRSLVILSGHRCPASNRAVGGAPRSRHVVGDAADIPKGYATVKEAAAAGAVGIGDSDGWAVHVDVRPGPPARWSY